MKVAVEVESKETKKMVRWVPLPFHPVYSKQINKTLQEYSGEPMAKHLWRTVFKAKADNTYDDAREDGQSVEVARAAADKVAQLPIFKAAWRNSAPHLHQRVHIIASRSTRQFEEKTAAAEAAVTADD